MDPTDEVDIPGPEPTMDRDPQAFQVMSAAQAGPTPPDVERELRQLAEAVGPVLDEREGVIGTRFGRRAIVAPVDAPQEAVDVADVDLSRQLVLTLGGEDPTPEGSLLAQVLFQRREVSHGYARAPEITGPTFSVLERVLPGLRGGQAVEADQIGRVAVGHRPSEIAGAVEGLLEQHSEEDEHGEGSKPGSVNTV